MDENWNSDAEYVFSVTKMLMWLYGIWPFRDNAWAKVRWSFMVSSEFAMGITFLMEAHMACGGNVDVLEMYILLEAAIRTIANNVCGRIHLKKIGENFRSAIDDWSAPEISENSRRIMTRYARMSRLFSVSEIICVGIALMLFFTTAASLTTEKFDTTTNVSVVSRGYIISANCLYGDSYNDHYIPIFTLQVIQGLIQALGQCCNDSFFINITLHLCGQLEILRTQFVEFGERSNEMKESGKHLGALIRRHCCLIELARNIEDTFHISILLQILMDVIFMALTSLHVTIVMGHNNSMETTKAILSMLVSLFQTIVVVFIADTVQVHSESIHQAIYEAPWHKISSSSAKKLMFVMMRSSTPIRLSAGKFFYVSRVTMIDTLKATFSYISLIRMSMNDVE